MPTEASLSLGSASKERLERFRAMGTVWSTRTMWCSALILEGLGRRVREAVDGSDIMVYR